jgi:hypothetical protein
MKRIKNQMRCAGRRLFSLKYVMAGMQTPQAAQECRERASIVQAAHACVQAQVHKLPWLSLQGSERNALGGVIFQRAPDFVKVLCQTILEHPLRYPDLQERAEFLLARHEEAERWSRLADELGSLHELANDQLLAARGESVTGAVQLVHLLEGAAAIAPLGGQAWERLLGVSAAWGVLEENRRAKGRSEQRSAKDKGDPDVRRQRALRWEGQLMEAFRQIVRRQRG